MRARREVALAYWRGTFSYPEHTLSLEKATVTPIFAETVFFVEAKIGKLLRGLRKLVVSTFY